MLDRAIKLGRWRRPWQYYRRWAHARDAIAARVRTAVGADGLLPQIYGNLPGVVSRMDALCTVLPRLLPEEIDLVERTALGNVPLVWSHAELARSLYVLDAVQRQRRWGRVGLWIWRLGRYLNLRLRRMAR